MIRMLPAALLVTALLGPGCAQTAAQSTATLMVSYDGALAAEISYLTSRPPDPATATSLRALRHQASAAMKALALAETAQQPTATLATSATLAVSAYAIAAVAATKGI